MCMPQPNVPAAAPPPPAPAEEVAEEVQSGLVLRRKRREMLGTKAPSLTIQRPSINLPS